MLFVLALFLKRRPLAPEVPREYKVHYVRRDAMTPTELKFFARLVAALPNSVVAPQVAMSALVDIAEHQKRGKYKHVNMAKISKQRLDYVVFDKVSGKVACVIELDDHSHDSSGQREKDAERDSILAATGYRMVRFDARRMPSAEELPRLLAAV